MTADPAGPSPEGDKAPGAARKARTGRATTPERDRGSGQAPGRAPDGDTRVPYEQAREQLTEVVRRLESGGLTLEESLSLWERGEQLATICTDWLEGARARLAAVTREPGGTPGQEAPF